MAASTVRHRGTGIVYRLRDLGAVKPVIEAGGLFGYARSTGMIGGKGPAA